MTKVGDQFLEAFVDEDTGKVEWHTWVVRSIRKGRVYATVKMPGVTWGKVSKKHGDYGWLDPVPSWCRQWWYASHPSNLMLRHDKPATLGSTKIGALRSAIKAHKEYSLPEDYPDPTMWQKALDTLNRMLAKERK